MMNLTRVLIAVVALAEAVSLFGGAALHLGIALPGPFLEPRYLPSAVLEGGAGAVLLVAVWRVAVRRRRGWRAMVAGHVVGVVAIVAGIGARATGRAPRLAVEVSHHPPTLLVLLVVLVVLALPPIRRALGPSHRYGYRRRSSRTESEPAP